MLRAGVAGNRQSADARTGRIPSDTAATCNRSARALSLRACIHVDTSGLPTPRRPCSSRSRLSLCTLHNVRLGEANCWVAVLDVTQKAKADGR